MHGLSDFNLVCVVQPNIIALKLLGFWKSPNSDSIFSTVWYKTYTILMLFLPAILNISGFWYLYDKRESLTVEDISSVVFIYPTTLINIMMMVVIYLNIDMIHFIQSDMQATKFQPKTLAQVEDAKKWTNTAHMFHKVFFINNSLTVPTQALLRILKGDKLLLAAHDFPGLNWKMFYIYQVVTCAASCLMCSTYVTLVTSLLIEIMIQLRLLERSLQVMEDVMDLKNCVEWHLDILVFVKKVQKFCGIGVTAVFMCSVFNICTSLALTVKADVTDLPFLVPYLGAMVAIIYSNCWCGSEVTYQSEKISHAIYSSKWPDADVGYMKLIHIHILLTNQPLEITLGGGTFSASLPVFVMVIKTAYSVLTLLQRLED